MKNNQLLEGLEKEAASLVEAYVADGGGRVSRAAARWFSPWEVSKLAQKLGALEAWDAEAKLCIILLFRLAGISGDYRFVRDHFKNHEAELLDIAAEMEEPPDPGDLAAAILDRYLSDAKFADEPTAARPFRSAFTNYVWEHLDWSVPV